MLIENMSFGSQLPTPFSVTQMLDDSGQSLPSFRRTEHTTVSPAPDSSWSSTPRADTPVEGVLSEAQVSIKPSLGQELDPDETLVKIVTITKKEPDPKDPKDPQ